MKIFSFLFLVSVLAMFAAGCGPTYPWELVDEAVVQLCKEEYGIDVKVKLAGTTIAVYLPIEDLLGQDFRLSEEARDKVNDVVMSVSRVTLNTDKAINFYIVIAQDPEFPEFEVVIVRYVEDIKMYHYTQISRDDFAERALIEMKLTPQAEKERILRTVFEEFGTDEGVEEILNEYMSEDVGTIGDIGYWNSEFYIKEISLEEFLALQIASRARRAFENNTELAGKFRVNYIKGKFADEFGRKNFEFDLDVAPAGLDRFSTSREEKEIIFKTVLDTAAFILRGYKFEDYDNVSLLDAATGDELVAGRLEMEDYEKGKLKLGSFLWIN